jgi:hypothetical protein
VVADRGEFGWLRFSRLGVQAKQQFIASVAELPGLVGECVDAPGKIRPAGRACQSSTGLSRHAIRVTPTAARSTTASRTSGLTPSATACSRSQRGSVTDSPRAGRARRAPRPPERTGSWTVSEISQVRILPRIRICARAARPMFFLRPHGQHHPRRLTPKSAQIGSSGMRANSRAPLAAP